MLEAMVYSRYIDASLAHCLHWRLFCRIQERFYRFLMLRSAPESSCRTDDVERLTRSRLLFLKCSTSQLLLSSTPTLSVLSIVGAKLLRLSIQRLRGCFTAILVLTALTSDVPCSRNGRLISANHFLRASSNLDNIVTSYQQPFAHAPKSRL
jgi:hypothetical protein